MQAFTNAVPTDRHADSHRDRHNLPAQRVYARQVRTASGEYQTGRYSRCEFGTRQFEHNQPENLLDPSPDNIIQVLIIDAVPVLGYLLSLVCPTRLINRQNTAILPLHLLGDIEGQSQTDGDISGELIASYRQNCCMPDAAIFEDGDVRGA